jgi:cyclophilin family peptidyl-prolyl cis-trans isomerase
MEKILLFFLLYLISNGLFASNPQVVMKTSKGDIEIELYDDKVHDTVSNFLSYVDSGFYKNTVFHRVIKGFMIQGGGFDKAMIEKKAKAPIKNEAKLDLKNEIGTISMARTNVIDSATAQFFINTADNISLDHRGNDQYSFGYAVFGKVIKGMPVVKTIESAKTGIRGPMEDVPLDQIVILDIVKKK